jgi:hypothetical protein
MLNTGVNFILLYPVVLEDAAKVKICFAELFAPLSVKGK